MNEVFGFTNFPNPQPRAAQSGFTPDVVFKGRSRVDAKRALLKYWSENENRLGMQLDEFKSRCSMAGDDTIVFHPPLKR